MGRFAASLGLAGLVLAQAAPAANLVAPVPPGRFRATCEDLGRLCFADACGRDQIEAALICRARCPSAVVTAVIPVACSVPEASPTTVLRRRG